MSVDIYHHICTAPKYHHPVAGSLAYHCETVVDTSLFLVGHIKNLQQYRGPYVPPFIQYIIQVSQIC